MPIYKYKGKNRQGREIKAEIEAENKEAAQKLLRSQQIVVTSLKAKPKDIEIKIPGLTNKIKDKDLILKIKDFCQKDEIDKIIVGVTLVIKNTK